MLENIIFALGVKFIVLLAAAIDRVGIVKMWVGVFADVGVSLIAVINSLRISTINQMNIFKSLFKKSRR